MTDCVDNTNDITVLSLCTGYGGLELGLHRALGRSLRVVAVEIEAYAQANLVAKAEEGKLAIEAVYPDLKTFPAERFSGCFDFILAGYPCQPFSVAGKRKGKDDPRHLWPYIQEHIAAIRPLFVFCENVGGHLQMGFDEVYRSLAGMGYSVEAGLFTAAECGAPHKRERLFILAYTEGDGTMREARGVCKADGRQGRTLPRQLEQSSQLGNPRSDIYRELAGSISGPPKETFDATGQPRQIGDNAGNAGELADTAGERIQGHEPTGDNQTGGQVDELCYDRWPARPGQNQYDWEKPRVLADNNSRGGGGKQRYGKGFSGTRDNPEQAKPRLGRAVNGPQSRVDRLRLLGNGVVPTQAELAFRTLMEMFND